MTLNKLGELLNQKACGSSAFETVYASKNGGTICVRSHFNMSAPFDKAIYPAILYNIREQARQPLEKEQEN